MTFSGGSGGGGGGGGGGGRIHDVLKANFVVNIDNQFY